MSHASHNDSSDEEYHSATEEERTTSLQENERPLRTQLASMSVSGPGCIINREGLEEGREDEAGVRTETESGVVAEEGRELEPEQGSEDGDTGPRTGLDEKRGAAEQAGAESTPGNEYVTGLDNRYVSEDVIVKGEEVELTEEQVKELKEQANKLKKEGNEEFHGGEYSKAVDLYSEALKIYPPGCEHESAVCHANRAACYMKMEEHQSVIDDCTKALELEPDYLKAMVRRAQAHEALKEYEGALDVQTASDEKLDESLDYKKVLELDPSQSIAGQAVMYLPDKIKEEQEKLKADMMGKLKELGDAVLRPFGLSTSNFEFNQDPNTGGYSVNFKR